MLDEFNPIMQQANVDKTADYYNRVFVPLGGVVPAMSQENVTKFQGYLEGIKGMQTDSAKLIPGLAAALNMSEEQVQQFLGTNFPAMAQMLAGLPQMSADFGNLLSVMATNVGIFQEVPAGLEHYKPLVSTMQANVSNYDSVNSLPNFRLFTWFFVIPGLLMVLLAGFGLMSGHHLHFSLHRQHIVPGGAH
ncbi:MAG TPA: hypothetical protein VH761_12400 [Ilumatobacteraceae bacterium]